MYRVCKSSSKMENTSITNRQTKQQLPACCSAMIPGLDRHVNQRRLFTDAVFRIWHHSCQHSCYIRLHIFPGVGHFEACFLSARSISIVAAALLWKQLDIHCRPVSCDQPVLVGFPFQCQVLFSGQASWLIAGVDDMPPRVSVACITVSHS